MCEYPNRPADENPYSFSAIHAFGFELSHADHSWLLQNQHRPHEIVKGTTTRSPTLSLVFSEPTATTSPMNSWPSTSPLRIVGMKPSSRWRSDPQMAVSVILMIASLGFTIEGSGTLLTRTSFVPYQQSARIVPVDFFTTRSRSVWTLAFIRSHLPCFNQLLEAPEILADLGRRIPAHQFGDHRPH